MAPGLLRGKALLVLAIGPHLLTGEEEAARSICYWEARIAMSESIAGRCIIGVPNENGMTLSLRCFLKTLALYDLYRETQYAELPARNGSNASTISLGQEESPSRDIANFRFDSKSAMAVDWQQSPCS